MSDKELRQAFINKGFKPGPCNPATRKTLQTIYLKMQSGEDVSKFFYSPPSSTTEVLNQSEPTPEESRNFPRTPYSDSMMASKPAHTSAPTPSAVGKPDYLLKFL